MSQPELRTSLRELQPWQYALIGAQGGLMMGVVLGAMLPGLMWFENDMPLAANLGAITLVAVVTGAGYCTLFGPAIQKHPTQGLWGLGFAHLLMCAFVYALALFIVMSLRSLVDNPGHLAEILFAATLCSIAAVFPLPLGFITYPSFVLILRWARRRMRALASAQDDRD